MATLRKESIINEDGKEEAAIYILFDKNMFTVQRFINHDEAIAALRAENTKEYNKGLQDIGLN